MLNIYFRCHVRLVGDLSMFFAIYRGDRILFVGDKNECAEYLGWKSPQSVLHVSSPSYKKKRGWDKFQSDRIEIFRIEDD